METVWEAYGKRPYARLGGGALTIGSESGVILGGRGWHPTYESWKGLVNLHKVDLRDVQIHPTEGLRSDGVFHCCFGRPAI